MIRNTWEAMEIGGHSPHSRASDCGEIMKAKGQGAGDSFKCLQPAHLDCKMTMMEEIKKIDGYALESGRRTSVGCARPQPFASRRGARP
jgi:hypothetical protein